jgi:peptidoglycan/xylan/chitin deacetylase (PgdA/CDA1 family)
MTRALVLTYHSVEAAPPPLHVEPALFERHAEVLAESGAASLTVSELAAALADGDLPERAVAITFDDGFANVAREAAPVLTAHGLRATVFAVSGHVGGTSDWPTQPASAPRLPLLDAAALRGLVSLGWEIGSHGCDHRPLGTASAVDVHEQLQRSREELEALVGEPVRAFAFPYGDVPAGSRTALAEAEYSCGCTTRLEYVTSRTDPLALPRVDAHYLRDPRRLRRAAAGQAGAYLALRRVAARGRRAVRHDWRSA